MTIDIKGDLAQIARMRGVEAAVLAAAQTGMEDAIKSMADILADYPPELPNQRYVRTNALHEGWVDTEPVFKPIASGIEGSLHNPVEYTPEVEGDATQADVHKGRWPTVGKVQAAQEGAARAKVEQAVKAKVGTL
jgi:hypothetical protein